MPSGNPVLPDLGYGTAILNIFDACRRQISLNAGNDPEYIGYTQYPGDVDAEPVWMIYKIVYTGTDETDRQIPLQGVGFKYVWDDRATYF